MAPRGGVRVNITGDSSQLKRELDQADREVSKFADQTERHTSRMSRAFSAVAPSLAVGAGAAAFFGYQSVMAASDAEQMAMRAEVAFGSAFKAIDEFSKQSADALGISRRDYLRFTSEFGAMFRGMGKAEDQAAFMSASMVDLAANVASFNDAAIPDVIDAMTSAFRGEYDALQKFIPTISDAAVKQYALNNGLGDGKTFADDAAKAQAIYGFMLANTSQQQGDVARSGDTMSQKLKESSAKFDDLKVAIGEKLYPVAVEALDWISGRLDDISEWWDRDGNRLFNEFEAGWGRFMDGWDGFWPRFDDGRTKLRDYFIEFSRDMEDAGLKFDDFKAGLESIKNDFPVGLRMVGDALHEFFVEFLWTEWWRLAEAIIGGINWMANTTLTVLDIIFNFAKGVIGWIFERFDWIIDKAGELSDILGPLGNALAGLAAGPAAGGAWNALGNIFRADGGPVMGGKPYIVGERGPELFVPGSSGGIVPNHALGGGGAQTINLVVDGRVLATVVAPHLAADRRSRVGTRKVA